MQAPLIIFDHIKKVVSVVTGPAASKRIEELLDDQRKQVATSGRPK